MAIAEEESLLSKYFPEDDSCGKYVGSAGLFLLLPDLGGRISCYPSEPWRERCSFWDREPEITKFRDTVDAYYDVLWVKITVDEWVISFPCFVDC